MLSNARLFVKHLKDQISHVPVSIGQDKYDSLHLIVQVYLYVI